MSEYVRGAHRVAVLLGGWSAEREVSLVSGAECAKVLRAAGHCVEEIDVGRDLAAELGAKSPDVCLNMLHGRWGEDGCVQGVLETLGIPYSHSGVAASALAMDKVRAKVVCRDAGLMVAAGHLFTAAEVQREHVLPPPYVVKPNGEGSSVDVTIVGVGDPPPSLSGERDTMLVEEYVPGLELTVAVLDGRPLEVTEIRPRGAMYDYAAKYEPGGSVHVIPAEVSKSVRQAALDGAAAAHVALGCRGVSRADFRYDPTQDRLVVLEVNTQPGMTPTSLVPEQADRVGIGFSELVEWMVEDATCPR